MTVLFTAHAKGAEGAASGIPFTYRAGLIWVQLDGPGAPLHFLLDSGASATVLDLQAARRLGLKFGRRETVLGVNGRCFAYRVDGLNAAIAEVPLAHSMLAIDLSPVSRSCGQRIDGLIGADFFRGRVVQIDFAAQKIRVLAAGELPVAGAEVIPLAVRNDALCVRASVNGHALQWLRLDTGCDSALEWVPGGYVPRNAAGASIATAKGSGHAIETDVALGPERFTAVKTGLHEAPMFAGESGLLGTGLLSRFCVTVDTAGSRLLLGRNRATE